MLSLSLVSKKMVLSLKPSAILTSYFWVVCMSFTHHWCIEQHFKCNMKNQNDFFVWFFSKPAFIVLNRISPPPVSLFDNQIHGRRNLFSGTSGTTIIMFLASPNMSSIMLLTSQFNVIDKISSFVSLSNHLF